MIGIPQADALLAGDGAVTLAAERDETGTRVTGLSVGAFVAIMIFLLMLLEGLLWAWTKGILTWE